MGTGRGIGQRDWTEGVGGSVQEMWVKKCGMELS